MKRKDQIVKSPRVVRFRRADPDPPLRLRPRRAAAVPIPCGLAFCLSVDVEPTVRAFDLLADMIERGEV